MMTPQQRSEFPTTDLPHRLDVLAEHQRRIGEVHDAALIRAAAAALRELLGQQVPQEPTLPAPASAAYDEFRHYAPSAKAGVLHIRSLPDAIVLAAARDPQGAEHRQVFDWMEAQPPDPGSRPGFGTNPSWVTAQCAEEAYNRDLIDEQELDWITR